MTAVPGSDVLRWVIASSSLEVRCRGGVCPEEWSALFPAYAVSDFGSRPPDIVLEASPVVGWENPREIRRGDSAWWSTPTPAGERLEWADFACEVRREAGALRGSVVADGGGGDSLAGAIRSVLCHALLGRGMLLHASGVVRRGKLWLFTGYAGAGKTTVARELNGGGVPFAVDRVVLLREGEAVRAFPTPFSDPRSEVDRGEPRIPAAVVVLEQGRVHGLRRLSLASAASTLLHHGAWNWRSLEVMTLALDTAAWTAERVPVFALTFARDAGFWELLDGAAEGAADEGDVDD